MTIEHFIDTHTKHDTLPKKKFELSNFKYDPFIVKPPMGFKAPYRINFETNETCNMSCGFCFGDFYEGVIIHKEAGIPVLGLLETAEIKAMIYQTAEMGASQFLFGGGDPFIRKDIIELIEYAYGTGLQIVVDTNALLIATRDDLFDRSAPYIHQLGLSIDGSTAENHDRFRQSRGSFDKVLKVMQVAREKNLRLKINTVITAQNTQDITAMVPLLAPYTDVIKRWSLDQFIPLNRGAQNRDAYFIEYEEYMRVIRQVKKLAHLDGRFNNEIWGGGLKRDKAGTVIIFGPQGIPYVTFNDQKYYVLSNIRTTPLFELIDEAVNLNLDIQKMNTLRYATSHYRDI